MIQARSSIPVLGDHPRSDFDLKSIFWSQNVPKHSPKGDPNSASQENTTKLGAIMPTNKDTREATVSTALTEWGLYRPRTALARLAPDLDTAVRDPTRM